MLELIALILAGIHFGIPLTYYYYAKTRWLSKPWNIKIDENYRPKITIIIPKYNKK
jgi:biofilm PGA synthesis N-glycosyltransferase PgaC